VLRESFGFFTGYWLWVTDIFGVLTVAAGLIAAAGAFNAAYLKNDAWSGDWTAWAGLWAAVAAAFIAGGTTGRLAQNIYGTKEGEGDADKKAAPQ
jgi:hypothetical protein